MGSIEEKDMSDLLRPSKLGDWATCAKKARYIAANPKKDTGNLLIATWVGNAVHQKLASSSSWGDNPAPGTLYDNTTPNFSVAMDQVGIIIEKFEELMEVHGLKVIDHELEVNDVDNSGTLDMVLRSDCDGWLTIGDLKTGKRVPSGAWLQLGSYFQMAKHDFDFQKRSDYLHEVAVIHIPRTPLNEAQYGSIESRIGVFCGEQSNVVYHSILELIEQDRDVSEFPASPGVACASCEMSVSECPVKIVTKK